MLCLFGSCFSGRTNAVSSRDGSHIDNEDLRPRHMLVRHSAKKQGLFAQQRSFGRSSVSLVDEKLALKGVEAGFRKCSVVGIERLCKKLTLNSRDGGALA
jgi:hypothetical protein